uniref:Integrase catalytic domain-containing protein n=1 Tax=Cannabis sativa TaxID=3483 RepID=A0A803Q6A2_CANSA
MAGAEGDSVVSGRNGRQYSTSNIPASINPAQTPNVVVPHFGSTLNQPFTLKLDINNFTLWRTMVVAIVRGHRLDGYLKGTLPRPQEYNSVTTNVDGSESVTDEINPAFEQWIVNDQLLLGWPYGSMTKGIASEVMGCDSSSSLWSALEALYGSHSKAIMDEYRTKIQTARKHLDYLPIVLLIEARPSTSWQELQDMLLSFDSKMERLTAFSTTNKLGNNSGNPKGPTTIEEITLEIEVAQEDKVTKQVVLQGRLKDGLYQLELPSTQHQTHTAASCFKLSHFSGLVTSTKLNVNQSKTGEYQAFTRFVTDHSIAFDHSCPHTSAQNGRAERKHRHIVEMGLTLLAQASVPQNYWWDAFQTSVYLINRLPTSVLGNKTPYELVFSKQPDYRFLKVFGSACFPCLRPYQSHKFQFHSTKCVNLGYSDSHRGYKCLSSIGRLYISQHVVFNEHEFPFRHGFLNTHHVETLVSVTVPYWSASVLNSPSQTFTPGPSADDVHGGNNSQHQSPPASPLSSTSASTSQVRGSGYFDHFEMTNPPESMTEFPAPNIAPTNPDSRAAEIEMPTAEPDISAEAGGAKNLQPTHPMITRAKAGVFKPKTYLRSAKWEKIRSEPCSLEEALRHSGWNAAMKEEICVLIRNKTWKMVRRTADMNVIENKWVYREKRNVDGSFQRYKARLVAKGQGEYSSNSHGLNNRAVFSVDIDACHFGSLRAALTDFGSVGIKASGRGCLVAQRWNLLSDERCTVNWSSGKWIVYTSSSICCMIVVIMTGRHTTRSSSWCLMGCFPRNISRRGSGIRFLIRIMAWEKSFIKDDISSYVNSSLVTFTQVAFMIGRVSQEQALMRSHLNFVGIVRS